MTAPERLSAPSADSAANRMGLDGILVILRRQIWLVLAIIALVMAGTVGYMQTLDERFRARATLVLTLSDTRVNRTAIELESFELSRAIVETELDVLRSRVFAGEVAEALSLAGHPAFAPDPDAPPTTDEVLRAAVIDRLLASYSVFRSGESLAIEIVAESVDPELTASIANGVAQTYIDINARRQRREIQQSIAFLEQRVLTLSDQLTEAESELVDFIRGNDLDDDGQRDLLHAEEARLRGILAVIDRSEADQAEADRVRAELAEVSAQLHRHTRAELALMRMERAMDLLQGRYQVSVERLNQMESQLDFVPQSARQVTVARAPVEASSPNRRLMLALSLVAATVLAFVAALIVDSFNRRIWSEEDMQRLTGLRNLGAVPRVRRRGLFRRPHGPLRVLAESPPSAFVEALRGILTLWTNTRRVAASKVLMVSSSLPGEGKSTVAVSLAGSAALDGLRVLLVDFDAQRGGATKLAEVEPQQVSLEDIADGATRPGELCRPSPIVPGLDVISLGTRGRINPRVLQAAQDGLMPMLRETYDLILLDTPPVLVLDDACRLGRLADEVLIVVRWGATTYDTLFETHERLARNGLSVAGTVLNDVDPRKRKRYRLGVYHGDAAYGGRFHAPT